MLLLKPSQSFANSAIWPLPTRVWFRPHNRAARVGEHIAVETEARHVHMQRIQSSLRREQVPCQQFGCDRFNFPGDGDQFDAVEHRQSLLRRFRIAYGGLVKDCLRNEQS